MANHKILDKHTIACFRISKKMWAKFAKACPNRSEIMRSWIEKEVAKYELKSKNENSPRK